MQRLSSGMVLLGLASGVAARVAPYRRSHVRRYCHSVAQSSGTAVQPSYAVVETTPNRTLNPMMAR